MPKGVSDHGLLEAYGTRTLAILLLLASLFSSTLPPFTSSGKNDAEKPVDRPGEAGAWAPKNCGG